MLELQEDNMYLGQIIGLTALFRFVKCTPIPTAESTEDHNAYTYAFYSAAPSTVSFHDIYSHSLALLTDDPSPPTIPNDTFHINKLPRQFVEFPPISVTVPVSTTPAPPKPKYPSRLSYLEQNESTEETSTSSTSTTTTTEEPEEGNKVLPITRASKYQRGVLDLLFPAARVRNFKSVFDTVRKLLSHTF